jgi:hypothetical protein
MKVVYAERARQDIAAIYDFTRSPTPWLPRLSRTPSDPHARRSRTSRWPRPRPTSPASAGRRWCAIPTRSRGCRSTAGRDPARHPRGSYQASWQSAGRQLILMARGSGLGPPKERVQSTHVSIHCAQQGSGPLPEPPAARGIIHRAAPPLHAAFGRPKVDGAATSDAFDSPQPCEDYRDVYEKRAS